MEPKFDVDFTEVLRQVNDLKGRLNGLGSQFDRLESQGVKASHETGQALKLLRSRYDDIRSVMIKQGVSAKKAEKATKDAYESMARQVEKVSQANAEATLKVKAYQDSQLGLKRVLDDTASKKAYIKGQEKLASLNNELKADNEILAAKLERVHSKENLLNLTQRDRLKTAENLATYTSRQALEEQELEQQLKKGNSAQSQRLRSLRSQLKSQDRILGSGERLTLQEKELRDQLKNTQSESGKRVANLRARIATEERLQSAVSRRIQRGRELKETEQAAASAQSVSNDRSQARISIIRQLNTEETRWNAKVAEQERILSSLNGGVQETITRNQELIKARKDAIKAEVQNSQAVQEYTERLAQQEAAEKRSKAALDARKKVLLETAKATHRMTQEEAEQVALAEHLKAGNDRYNQSLVEQARRLYGTDKATKELSESRAKQQAQLEHLRSQVNLLSSAHGREAAELQNKIHEQKAYNKLLAMSNSQLLGFSSASRESSRGINAGAQATAAWRAALAGMQTSIGMYTGATVIAATATYALAAALRSTVTAGMDYTEMMSRAEAVMFSTPGTLESATERMAALDQQVRALGQSTVFTATEVSQGLVDLGMAGLSSSQALMALKPTLDLASIGAIEMGTAADIATNVMTAFKLEASDIPDVVNVMATAVTNANTNIEQLANALSYVGPAAQAAGYSMRDTIAAIELLSNAGIKSSKAGTGLRRMMLNLLNPTTKGAAVLDKYNISLVDSQGQTRGLMDVLGQLNSALHNDVVTPGERTAAIMDLVGVRAASAVSRLIGSTEELGALRRQLDNVSGAAEAMRQKIEDNLTADWKQLNSAFQDVQLDVFEDLNMYLREGSAQLTVFLNSLQEIDEVASRAFGFTSEQIASGEGISNLEVYIARLRELGETALWLGGAFIGFKTLGMVSTQMKGMSQGATAAADRLAILSKRLEVNRVSQQALSMQYLQTNVKARSQAVAFHGSATAASYLTGATSVLSGTMARLGTTLAWVSRAAGWIGMLAGVGYAIYSAFGSDKIEALKEHRSEVDKLKDSYDDYQETLKNTQQEANRLALASNLKAASGELDSLNAKIAEYTKALSNVEGEKAQQRINDKLLLLKATASDTRDEIVEIRKAMSQLATSSEEVESVSQEQDRLIAQLNERAEAVRALEEEMKTASFGRQASITGELLEANRALEETQQQLNATQEKLKEVSDNSVSYLTQMTQGVKELRQSLADERMYENLTDTEKLVKTRDDLDKVMGKIKDMQAALNDPDTENPGLDVFKRALQQVFDLVEAEEELKASRAETAAKTAEDYEALLEYRLTEEERLERLRAKLAEVNFEQFRYFSLLAMGKAEADHDKQGELYRKRLDYLKAIAGLEESINGAEGKRGGRRSGKSEETKRLEEARRALDSLRQGYAPLKVAQDQYDDRLRQLTLLYKKGEIGTIEYAQAQMHILEKFNEAKEAADPYLSKLKEVREEFTGFLDDAEKFYSAQGVIANIEGPEGDAASFEWNRRRKDRLFEDMPDTQVLSAETGGAFGELNQVNQRAEQEREWYQQALEEQRLFLATKKQNEVQHAAEVAALMKQHQENQRQLESQAQTARLTGYANMFGSMANLAATFAGDSSGITKTLLAFQQAANLAATISNMAKGQSEAIATMGPIAGAAKAAELAVMGANLASTISSIASPDTPSFSTSNYAGAYDKGGHIPSGSYGIAGEYGPEIVQGPANVTSRKDTAKLLAKGGGESLTISPQINVTVEGTAGATEEEQRETGRAIGQQVEVQVLNIMNREMRPNGMLDKWKRQ